MRYTTSLLLLLCLVLCGSFSAQAGTLTVERIFAAPDLSGPRLREVKFSPDGRYVTFLQGKAENKDQLDLWGFDTRTGKSELLVDSHAFVSGTESLSAEEEARRERQRTASLRGIVEYSFSENGRQVLLPMGGDLYLYELGSSKQSVRRLTASESYETDARFSPRGRYVSFIRDQDLFIIDLATGVETALTSDGEELVQNGVAEFIAQEEMDRDTGYWWSPDEQWIAFTRIDDTPVQEVERFEINAEGASMSRQRYPAAGTANTRVELKTMRIRDRSSIAVDIDFEGKYLARVDWFPDSASIAVQRQSRDQKVLELWKVDASKGSARVLFEERSPHWVELNHDLHFLENRQMFVWSSRRSEYKHLYLYDWNGQLIRPLTAGPWMVVGDGVETGFVGVNEKEKMLYFMANKESPLERHLYSASLDTRKPDSPRKLSREPGWHDAKLLPKGTGYFDIHSSPEQPPTASVRALDGSLKYWMVRNAIDNSHPYATFKSDHVQEEFGSITASDGQALFYRLLKPAHLEPGKRYPVVIDTYGGPHFQYVRKDWMGGTRAVQGYFRQILAHHGFVVFTLDNRGSGFRGSAFEAAIAGQLGRIEVEDQLRGVEFLKTQDFVDPARIGIMGWSYGGYMTLMAMTNTDVFRAGVAGAPVTDWRLYDTHYTERYLGMPSSNAKGYEHSSALADAEKHQGRLLLVHGMADDNVLFTHTTMLMQQLQASAKQFDVMTYPGGKHGLVRMPQTGRHYYETVLRFFEENLGIQ
jgi:dipeptidyl-peptidase 4